MATPISECRAKNGPLTCRYHGKAVSAGISRRISQLNDKVAALSGASTALSGEQREELAAAVSELAQRKAEAKLVKREQESAKVHRSVSRTLANLAASGTEDVPGHPSSVDLDGAEVPVVRGHRLPANVKRQLAKNGYSAPDMMEIDAKAGGAEAFAALMEKTRVGKYASSVYVYPTEDYENMRLFTSEHGECGYALKYHEEDPSDELSGKWNIVSVFTMPKSARTATAADAAPTDASFSGIGEHVAQSMLLQAVANGGRVLDCFDTVLPQLYASVGFKEYGRDEWNDEYRPDGWDEAVYAAYNGGRPDVVYMEWEPEASSKWSSPSAAAVSKMDFSYIDDEGQGAGD